MIDLPPDRTGDPTDGPLEDFQVLVLDCQTTGGSAERHDLIEIGWLPVRAADVGAGDLPAARTYLVRQPGNLPLPGHVAKLTGIGSREMEAAVDAEVIWAALAAAAGGVMRANGMVYCPTVIHYARFEMAFLKKLHRQVRPPAAFPFEAICTHTLAARLLPELPRKGLRAVAGYLGYSVPMAKRCDSHIRATTHIWKALTRRLTSACGISTYGDLKRWLEQTPAGRPSRRTYPLSRTLRLTAPDKPGVYRYSRSNGDLLYIGKAISLKRRINSYFQGHRRHSENTLEMLSQAVQLDFQETDSALEAALLESDAIKQCQPPYNQALTADSRNLVFISHDMGRSATQRDDRCCLGPVPSAAPFKALHHAGRLLGLVQGPPMDQDHPAILPQTEPYGPEDDIAFEGAALFAEKRHDLLDNRDIWRSLLRIGNCAWREKMKRLQDLLEKTETEETDAGKSDAQNGFTWTPESVSRALEANLRQCGFLLRRARWLTLLSEASLAWPHRRSQRQQLQTVVIRHGCIAEKGAAAGITAIPIPPGHRTAFERRQSTLDLATYDRLRVLTTEIRRILSGGRDVYIRLNRRVLLKPCQLKRLLWWL
jgi:DNA polymerase-3 subunit epsilon